MGDRNVGMPGGDENKPKTEAEKQEQEKREIETKQNQLFMEEAARELGLLDAKTWFYRIDENDPKAPRYADTDFNGIRTGNATIPKERLKLENGDYKSDIFPGKVFRVKDGLIMPIPPVRITHVPPFPPTGVKEFRDSYLATMKAQYSQGCRTIEIDYQHEIDVRLVEVNEIMSIAKELGMKVTFSENVQKVINRMVPEEKAKVDNERITLDILYAAKQPMRDGAERAFAFENETSELNKNQKWEEQYPQIATKATQQEKEEEFLKQLFKTASGELKGDERLTKIESEIKNIESRKNKLDKSRKNLSDYQGDLKEALARVDKRKGVNFDEVDAAIKAETDPIKKEKMQRERLELSVNLDPHSLSQARKKNETERGDFVAAIDKEFNDLMAREKILHGELTKIAKAETDKPEADRNQAIIERANLLKKPLDEQSGDLSKAIQTSKSDFAEVKNFDKEIDQVIQEKAQERLADAVRIHR